MAIKPPVYEGMPPTEREFIVSSGPDLRWGRIICGGPCKNYARVITNHKNGRILVLQRAAMKSILHAEDALNFDIVILGGSYRSCELQEQLYRSDRNRFAPPDKTSHTRGLGIDVSQAQSKTRLQKIHNALMWRHWHQSRPDDEPWHYSFGIKV